MGNGFCDMPTLNQHSVVPADSSNEQTCVDEFREFFAHCFRKEAERSPSAVSSGCQPFAPCPNRPGVHTARDETSVPAVRKGVGEHVSSFLEALLIYDERHDTEEALLAEDSARLPWLRTVAKIASRDIKIFCFPVSEVAGKYLKHELEKIKSSAVQSATLHGNTRWWLSDSSTEVSGQDRAQRLVTALIRAETKTHAFDSTPRKRPRKDQKQSGHSIFRTLAQDFVPPSASPGVIASNGSNHPVAGSNRKVGVAATREALHAAGYQMYDESVSDTARDAKGTTGRREVHTIKDLQHPNPDGKFQPGMVYTFNDQDMYIDSFEKYAGENMVIITPEYNKLAGVGTDSVWYYTISTRGDVVVTERVASINGATYTDQRPWDYAANDFIFIEHLGKTAFTTYNVCIQYQKSTHHKWVWLARNTTTNLSKSVCDMMLCVAQGSPLEGVALKKANNVVIVPGESKLKQDTMLMGLFGETQSPTYSIKYAYDRGPDTSVELSENVYKVFDRMGKNRPKGYGTSEVKRTAQMHLMWRPGGIEPLLVVYFGIPTEFRPWPNIMYTSQAGSLDEDIAEEGNAVHAAPNIAGGGPGVADTKSKAAHDAYEHKRLREFSNKIDPTENIKEIVSLLLPRFIDQVSGESGIAKGSVTLCARHVIYDKRTQRLQAARLQRHAELVARDPMPKTNLKHEVAPKASTAPRGITQYTEEMAIQTGRVGLLVKEVLKHCEFYQPGNSPTDIAMAIRKITEIAMEASNIDEDGQVSGMHDTDYSKMDETISEYIYSIFVEFVLAFVHPNDYEEVKTVLADNVDLTTMLNGRPIKTGFKNNSGSGVTTELNTVVSAFIEYVSTCLAITKSTHRLRHPDWEELDLKTVKKTTIRKALKYYAENSGDLTHLYWGGFMFKSNSIDFYSIPYVVIGPKFGDDGVGPHLPGISDDDWGASAIFFTEAIGMKLKVAFTRPQDGTFFLGRYYPRPLESLASYADVPKACRKLSIASNLDIEKYKLKLRGYWTTDSRTPGIREYLIAVARMYDVELRSFDGIVEIDSDGSSLVLTQEAAHLLATDRDMFYRVAGGPYCVEDDDVPMMTEAIADQLNFTAAELEQWLKDLEQCKTWEDIDAFQMPGMDYDPDAEPEGTTRMAGPVANLLSADSKSGSAGAFLIDELVVAAELALSELVVGETEGRAARCPSPTDQAGKEAAPSSSE